MIIFFLKYLCGQSAMLFTFIIFVFSKWNRNFNYWSSHSSLQFPIRVCNLYFMGPWDKYAYYCCILKYFLMIINFLYLNSKCLIQKTVHRNLKLRAPRKKLWLPKTQNRVNKVQSQYSFYLGTIQWSSWRRSYFLNKDSNAEEPLSHPSNQSVEPK